MKMTRIQIAEIAGVISVVLSLLFVAFQIQQTNQIAIVTAEIETRNNYSDLNEAMFSDNKLASLIERASDPEFQPAVGEDTQLRSLAFRFMNIWLVSEIAFRNGMLPQSSSQIVLDDIKYVLKTEPYMRRYFRLILENYPGWGNTEVVHTISKELAANETNT